MGDAQSSYPLPLVEIPPLTSINLSLALLGLPLLSLLSSMGPFGIDPVDELVIQWSLAITVIGIAVGIEDLSFGDIGFRRPVWVDFGYLFVTAVATLLVFAGTDPLVEALGLPVGEDAGTMTVNVGLGVALAGALTTGVVEEILFRGYPLERLLGYTDSPVLAGGCTWGAFTVAHAVVWPIGNLLQIAAVAALFTVVYLRRRTLVPVVGAHVLVWSISVFGQFYA